ncbi:UNVERIFIED_CONTAM: YTH domain-containing protein ECT3 [Sesamum radiatum]|uniref:YTH domain-containing family protein n=1 Tax=Sesamum radiatum TaxID=300843 RepID=A0AAW2S8S6_SESRA
MFIGWVASPGTEVYNVPDQGLADMYLIQDTVSNPQFTSQFGQFGAMYNEGTPDYFLDQGLYYPTATSYGYICTAPVRDASSRRNSFASVPEGGRANTGSGKQPVPSITSSSFMSPESSQIRWVGGPQGSENAPRVKASSGGSQLKSIFTSENGPSGFESGDLTRASIHKVKSKLLYDRAADDVRVGHDTLSEQNRGPRTNKSRNQLVNASGQFCGVAEMTGPVDFQRDMDFWQQDKWSGSFPVKWHIIKDLPNPNFRHIILENNENKPVTNSRDTQEICYKKGLEMLQIFKNYTSKTSLLDDFMYYENRQRILHEERSRLLRKSYENPYLVPLLDPPRKLQSPRDSPSIEDVNGTEGVANLTIVNRNKVPAGDESDGSVKNLLHLLGESH